MLVAELVNRIANERNQNNHVITELEAELRHRRQIREQFDATLRTIATIPGQADLVDNALQES